MRDCRIPAVARATYDVALNEAISNIQFEQGGAELISAFVNEDAIVYRIVIVLGETAAARVAKAAENTGLVKFVDAIDDENGYHAVFGPRCF